MSLGERKLEENEAKLDNILQKIVASSTHIQELVKGISPGAPVSTTKDLVDGIETLAKIIENLGILADEIDIQDEGITKELDRDIRGQLDEAILRIGHARKLLDE